MAIDSKHSFVPNLTNSEVGTIFGYVKGIKLIANSNVDTNNNEQLSLDVELFPDNYTISIKLESNSCDQELKLPIVFSFKQVLIHVV